MGLSLGDGEAGKKPEPRSVYGSCLWVVILESCLLSKGSPSNLGVASRAKTWALKEQGLRRPYSNVRHVILMEEIYKNTYQYLLSFDSHHTLKVDRMTHHFTDGETGPERWGDLPKTIQLLSGRGKTIDRTHLIPNPGFFLFQYPLTSSRCPINI